MKTLYSTTVTTTSERKSYVGLMKYEKQIDKVPLHLMGKYFVTPSMVIEKQHYIVYPEEEVTINTNYKRLDYAYFLQIFHQI